MATHKQLYKKNLPVFRPDTFSSKPNNGQSRLLLIWQTPQPQCPNLIRALRIKKRYTVILSFNQTEFLFTVSVPELCLWHFTWSLWFLILYSLSLFYSSPGIYYHLMLTTVPLTPPALICNFLSFYFYFSIFFYMGSWCELEPISCVKVCLIYLYIGMLILRSWLALGQRM